jgi:hypothetical protein
MQIRPEAERKLREGFQRRVDEQGSRYAPQLAYAQQAAAHFECGDVIGVYNERAGVGVRRQAYVIGLAPLALIPLLIAAAAAGLPGVLPVLGAFPFMVGAWFGISLIRGRVPRRWVWFYAFTEGFVLPEDPRASAAPVRWSEVTQVSEVWTDVYNVSAEESRPALTAYRLRLADGSACDISRSLRNVRDPYRDVGQVLRGVMPAAVSQTMPAFPSVDQIVARFAGPRG